MDLLRFPPLPVAAFCCLVLNPVARAHELWERSLADLGHIRLTSIASGTDTPVDKAAAIATVITAEDIEAIGAADIDQLLATVPGLHVGRSDQAFTPKYLIRGIASTYNPQTLFLINGIPVSSLFTGNRGDLWAGMPVKAVERIEVIRGPGSALYGADAFAGVINIVTRTRGDIGGTAAGWRIGRFDTRAAWVEHGGRYGDLDVAVVVEAESTDGWRRVVDADLQTLYDRLTGTRASRAPGPVNTMRRSAEARLDVSGVHGRLRAGYQGRYDVGSGPGYLEALDPGTRSDSERFNTDFSWNRYSPHPDWELDGRASYFYLTQQIVRDLRLLPPGSRLPGTGSVFPDGMIGNPSNRENHLRLDLNALYRGWSRHFVRLGAGAYRGDMFEVTETKNFTTDWQPRPGGLESVSDTPEVYLPEAGRRSTHVYAQDEWKWNRHWMLTTGVRHDRFSDFGGATNPRLALVWAPDDRVTTRLLYGRAFRAPSFVELYLTSNPIALGNPSLRPERIDTLELAFTHKVSPLLMYSANAYHYRIRDFITFVPAGPAIQAQNTGRRDGLGVELEADYSPVFNLRLLGHVSWQQSFERPSGDRVSEVPGQEAYLRMEWLFRPDWQWNVQTAWTGRQARAQGDRRPPLKDQARLDMTLSKRELGPGLDLQLTVRNLLDADLREPSPGPGATLPMAAIPNDFPMAGQEWQLEALYHF